MRTCLVVCAVGACLTLPTVLPTVRAQDPDYLLSILHTAGGPPSQATATIVLENHGEDVEGFRGGICHGDGVAVVEARRGGDLEELRLTVEVAELFDDGWTVDVLLDTVENVLRPGDGGELYSGIYDFETPGSAELEFCDSLLAVAVVVDGEEIEPVTESGTIIGGSWFLRGDVDSDGRVVPLVDGFLLLEADTGAFDLPCLDAADIDNDPDTPSLLDALLLLTWGFQVEIPPADPGPFECGPDPEGGDLGCDDPPLECPADPAELEVNSDYTLRISDELDGVESATARVTLEDAEETVEAYQFGVCHDEKVILGRVEIGEGIADDGFQFHEIAYFDGGWTVGAILDLEGADSELYAITYILVEAGTAVLEFCDTLGTPLIEPRVWAEGGAQRPSTEAGSIEIVTPTDPANLFLGITFETLTLAADDPQAVGGFSEVAVDGDWLLVGAPFEDNFAGSAYFFEWDDETREWTQRQQLSPESLGTTFKFGFSVAIHDDLALIGAPKHPNATPQTGAVYAFRWNGDEEEWVEDGIFEASDGMDLDNFGFAVAAESDLAVVGAHRAEVDDAVPGAVYVYRYDADSKEWNEEQKLVASDATGEALGPKFGFSVAVEGDVIVSGAAWSDEACPDDPLYCNSGSTYVFRWDDRRKEWVEEQKLTIEDPRRSDHFGRQVAFDGTTIAIAAPQKAIGVVDGAVYMFTYDGDRLEWVEGHELSTTDAVDGDFPDEYFGTAIALQGDVMVATTADVYAGSLATAYLFRRDSDGEWQETRKLRASDHQVGDRFGESAAVREDLVFIGVQYDDVGQAGGTVVGAGSVKVFDIDSPAFLRGDVDGNGDLFPLLDAIALLAWAFTGGDIPPCMAAADVDGNGVVFALIDAFFLLDWAFAGGDRPPEPGVEECGEDPSVDPARCLEPPSCP